MDTIFTTQIINKKPYQILQKIWKMLSIVCEAFSSIEYQL